MRNALFRRQALYACLFLGGVTAPVWADPALPFKHYQSWRDEPVQDWRTVNERVGEVGGWRIYLRESQPAGGGGAHDHGVPQPKPQPPGDAGHDGHHHHHHSY